MRNYLARLGWSHGDDEFFTDDQAKAWFDLDGIGKSPARFDLKKLENLCGQHIAVSDDAALRREIEAYLAAADHDALTISQADALERAMYCLKDRARTFPELLEKAHFVLASRPMEPDQKAAKALASVSDGILSELTPHLQNASWTRDELEATLGAFAEARGTKFGKDGGSAPGRARRACCDSFGVRHDACAGPGRNPGPPRGCCRSRRVGLTGQDRGERIRTGASRMVRPRGDRRFRVPCQIEEGTNND